MLFHVTTEDDIRVIDEQGAGDMEGGSTFASEQELQKLATALSTFGRSAWHVVNCSWPTSPKQDTARRPKLLFREFLSAFPTLAIRYMGCCRHWESWRRLLSSGCCGVFRTFSENGRCPRVWLHIF